MKIVVHIDDAAQWQNAIAQALPPRGRRDERRSPPVSAPMPITSRCGKRPRISSRNKPS